MEATKIYRPASANGPVQGINGVTTAPLFGYFEGGLFNSGWPNSEGATTWRSPSLVQNWLTGTIYAIAQGQGSLSDNRCPVIGLRRGVPYPDGNIAWGPVITIYTEASPTTVSLNNPCTVIDQSGKVYVLFSRGLSNGDGFGNAYQNEIGLLTSTTDGLTWPTSYTSLTTQAFNITGNTFSPITVTATASGASGRVRVTTAAHGLNTNYQYQISASGINNVTNGVYTVNVIDTTHFDLVGTTWVSNVSGGTATLQAGWIITSPTHGICLQAGTHAGRLIFPGYYRYNMSGASGVTSTANDYGYICTIYSDDGGSTWHVGQLTDETVSAAQGLIEPTAVELNTAGSIYFTARKKNGANRCHGVSTDYGATITSSTCGLDDGSSGTTNLPANTCKGGICRYDGTRYLQSYCSDNTSNRTRIQLRVSSNECTNWATGRNINYDWSGYNDVLVFMPPTIPGTNSPGPQALVVYEAGNVGDVTTLSISKIMLARISLTGVQNSTPALIDYFKWNFNELGSGANAVLGGGTIQDYGPFNHKVKPVSTDSTYPVYAAGYNSGAVAMQFGTTHYAVLTEANNSAMEPDYTGNLTGGSFTFEAVLKTTGTGVIVGGNPTGVGWNVQITAGGKLQLNISDGTHTAQVTGATTVNTGSFVKLSGVYDVPNHLLHVYVNGSEDATAVSTSLVTGTLWNTGEKRLLRFNDNSTAMSATCTIDWAKYSFGVQTPATPQTLLSLNAVEEPPPSVLAAPAALTNITGRPGNVLWLCDAYNLQNNSPDYNWSDHLANPVENYAPVTSLVDSISGYRFQLFATPGNRPGAIIRNDNQLLGPYFYFNSQGTGAGGSASAMLCQTIGGVVDFIPNTAVFTIACWLNPTAVGTQYTILDNLANAAGTHGVGLYLDQTTHKPQLYIYNTANSTHQIFYDVPSGGGALTANAWYHVVVVANGSGTVKFYVNPLGAPQAGALTSYNSSSSLVTPTLTATGTKALAVAGVSNASFTYPFQGGIKNLVISNQAWSASDALAHFNTRN